MFVQDETNLVSWAVHLDLVKSDLNLLVLMGLRPDFVG